MNDIRFLSPPKIYIWSPITTAEWPSLAQGFFPYNEAWPFLIGEWTFLYWVYWFIINPSECFIYSVVGDEFRNFIFSSSFNSNSALNILIHNYSIYYFFYCYLLFFNSSILFICKLLAVSVSYFYCIGICFNEFLFGDLPSSSKFRNLVDSIFFAFVLPWDALSKTESFKRSSVYLLELSSSRTTQSLFL